MTQPYFFGFGSPSQPTTEGLYDLGFGSSWQGGTSPADVFDPGFGDVGAGGSLAPGGQILPPGQFQTPPWYPDDGGEIFVLTLPSQGFNQLGQKFRVKAKHQVSQVMYPTGQVGLLSPVAEEGRDIVPMLDGERLRFVMPPLPPGVYDVYVYYGGGFLQVKVWADAFRVVFRHHSREQWSIRNQYPKHWTGAGPRSLLMEPPLVTPTAEWPHSYLDSWTRAVAAECQLMSGKAVTRLTQDLLDGDGTANVETTLGFPSAGRAFVGGREYTYTSRTPEAFVGLSAVRVYDVSAVAAGTEVVACPDSWVPEE